METGSDVAHTGLIHRGQRVDMEGQTDGLQPIMQAGMGNRWQVLRAEDTEVVVTGTEGLLKPEEEI